MSRPGIEREPPWWEASTLEKRHSNILLKLFGTSKYESATALFFMMKTEGCLMASGGGGGGKGGGRRRIRTPRFTAEHKFQ